MSPRPRSRTLGRAPTSRKALVGLGVTATALLAFPAVAGAQEADPVAVLGTQVNLLWVVLGAVLVIFMQAGFALVETGFCRAKHASHVVSTNFAIFGLGFVGYYLVGYGLMFGGYSVPLIGFDTAPGGPLIGSGEWIFLYKGGFALTDMVGSGGAGAAALGLLPLHGGLHGHGGHDPHRSHGGALEVEQLRRLGPLLRRHLLPALRGVDLGRWLALAARQLDGPRLRLRRLRRLRRRALRRCRRRPGRCHRARSSHRQVQR